MKRTVYLDHNATTPLDPRALEAMMPFLTSEYGNPSSSTHDWGLRARKAVEEARQSVAALIHAQPDEIVFTSGATEGNNLALRGIVHALSESGALPHLIATELEHASVRTTVEILGRRGCPTTFLPSDSMGQVHIEDLEQALRKDTGLVSVLGANGEIGTIQPVPEMAARCRERGVLFHCDATQSVGRVPVDVNVWQVDALALSSHKIYGPKGVGALFVRRGVELDALITGGGQERGMRSGTLNVPGIVGLGKAAELCREEMETHSARMREQTRALWEGIQEAVPDARLNGHPQERIPGTLNVAFPQIDSERLMLALEDFAISASSACHSGSGLASPIFTAIGLSPELASCSVRFGLGRGTTPENVQSLLGALEKAVRRLRGPVRGGTPSPVRYD